MEAANWQDCPEPMASRLDQGLNEATSVSRYCKAFDLARWVTDACQRAQAGTIDPGERQAVHRWLLQPSIKLNSRLLALVRRAPVVKDRQGEWVAPVDLAMLPARDAALLGDAVHAPASELARRSDLLRRLNVRRKVTAPDLLALAERVAASPDRAEPFEELLGRHSALLRPALVKALAGTPCLRSRSGAIAAPEDLHLATVSNIEWLDDDARIVGGSAVSLYRKLGCLSEPRADTLYAALAERRAANAPPPRPEDFYPALVEALKAEGAAVSRWSTEPILYLGGSYHAPEDCLVLQGSARLFSAALPVHRGSEAVARAFESLGASNVARPRHWLALFGWFQDRAAAHGGVLTRSEQTALREAYRRHLFHPALEVPADLRFLLSTTGRLFSQTDLAAHRLVENDYPALADGLEAIHAPMAFGDLDEHSRTMLRR